MSIDCRSFMRLFSAEKVRLFLFKFLAVLKLKNSALFLVLDLERPVSLVLVLFIERSVLSISKFFYFLPLIPFIFSALSVLCEVSFAMLLPILPVPFVGTAIWPEILEISVKSTM